MDRSGGELFPCSALAEQEGVALRPRRELKHLPQSPEGWRLANDAERVGLAKRPPLLRCEEARRGNERGAPRAIQHELTREREDVPRSQRGRVAPSPVQLEIALADSLHSGPVVLRVEPELTT